MPVNGNYCFNCYYYISKLVRALWLVNLAVRTLLHDQLNLKLVLLPNCCVTYHQIFLTYIASRSLKLSFTLNCVLKCANDHLNMISNWLVLLSTCSRNLNPFLTTGNRSRTRQTHNRDMINILLPSFFPSPTICGPRASRLGHKSKEKKTRSVTYGTDLELLSICIEYIKTTRTADQMCALYMSIGKLRRFSETRLYRNIHYFYIQTRLVFFCFLELGNDVFITLYLFSSVQFSVLHFSK